MAVRGGNGKYKSARAINIRNHLPANRPNGRRPQATINTVAFMTDQLGLLLAKLSLPDQERQGKPPIRRPRSESIVKRLANRLCKRGHSKPDNIKKEGKLSNNARRPQDDQPQHELLDMDDAAMAQYWPACQSAVLDCFPNMCPKYLMKVAASFKWDPGQIITSILDQQEKGEKYPTEPNTTKRKRADTSAEASAPKGYFEKDDTRLANKEADFVKQYNVVA